MKAAEFLAAQAPFKKRYATDERAAWLTLTAHGSVDDARITCKVDTTRGLAVAGLHPKTGGSGRELCSGDMLLEALVACAGVAFRAAAAVLEVPLKSAQVSAEGDIDLRGTLGVRDDVPVGFKQIRLRFAVDSDAPKAKLDELLKLTERYCVIYHTLRTSPDILVELNAA
jgi:uncharacterized OsmC-like protein